MRPVRTAARALLSGIFLASGTRAMANPEQFVPRAKRVTDRIAPWLEKIDSRLPTDTRALIQLNGVAQFVGGVLLATGRASRPAAALLAGSLVPTTMAGHPFWTVNDRTDRQAQQLHFMKNLGLFGGLLLAAADTEGRPGLRWRTRHALHDGRRSLRRTVRSARRDARIAVRSATTARRFPG